jgi:hypothetical protein
MNLMLKIMIYTICINFAVGIIVAALPELDASVTRGLEYKSDLISPFEQTEQLNPQSIITDATFQIARLLDLVGLGFINKIATLVTNMIHGLYAFPDLLEKMFAGSMNAALSALVFGALKGLCTVSYFLGTMALYTNRSLDKDRG